MLSKYKNQSHGDGDSLSHSPDTDSKFQNIRDFVHLYFRAINLRKFLNTISNDFDFPPRNREFVPISPSFSMGHSELLRPRVLCFDSIICDQFPRLPIPGISPVEGGFVLDNGKPKIYYLGTDRNLGEPYIKPLRSLTLLRVMAAVRAGIDEQAVLKTVFNEGGIPKRFALDLYRLLLECAGDLSFEQILDVVAMKKSGAQAILMGLRGASNTRDNWEDIF